MIEVVLLLLGFILIIKASDVLVDCASSLAIKAHVPKMLVALTIVSFGTCAPEVAISFQSIAANNGTMAFANVVGSCIVNVFLIVGLAAILRPIRVKHVTIKKELPILLIITSGFSILMLDRLFNPISSNVFSRRDGIILILLFAMFILYLVQMVKHGDAEEKSDIKYPQLWKAILYLILSLVVICISSELIVDNAVELARMLSVSEKIITMTAIVIGTSLPEMFMTVSSAKKGEFDMAIGNIIGTNIFNICIVLGLPVLIYGDVPLVNFSIVDILVVFLSSFNLYFFARSERKISKQEGVIMILIFLVYYTYLFMG